MLKALLVPVLAAGLAMGGAAKPANALTAEETAALLAGIAIVGVIASNSGNRASASTSSQATRRYDDGRRYDDRYDNRGNSGRVLPAECIRQVGTNRGIRYVAGERCLQQNGIRTSRLPDRCEITVRVGGRLRDGFRQRCLEDAGYKFRNSYARNDRRYDDRYDGRRTLGGKYHD